MKNCNQKVRATFCCRAAPKTERKSDKYNFNNFGASFTRFALINSMIFLDPTNTEPRELPVVMNKNQGTPSGNE
jgi:hypothetical protein